MFRVTASGETIFEDVWTLSPSRRLVLGIGVPDPGDMLNADGDAGETGVWRGAGETLFRFSTPTLQKKAPGKNAK